MTWEAGEIEKGLEDGLRQLEEQGRKETAVRIRPILFTNLTRGRVATYLDQSSACLPQEYVFRVADFYERLSHDVYDIQVLKATEVWLPLFKKMERWAFYYLRHSPLKYRTDLAQLAADYAADAGAQIIGAYFPFDVEFDAWAHVLLKRVCGKIVRNERKPGLVPDSQLVDLEKMLPFLADIPADDRNALIHLRQDLVAAIEQLPENYQAVILLRYREGLAFQQVSTRLGVSLATAHRWHFAALEELRKILVRQCHIKQVFYKTHHSCRCR